MYDYLDGKPAWFVAYATAVAKYVVENQFQPIQSRYVNGYTDDLTPLSEHMRECSIETLTSVHEEAEREYYFDSFDPNANAPVVMLSVRFSCACGEYRDTEAKIKDTITSVIEATLQVD